MTPKPLFKATLPEVNTFLFDRLFELKSDVQPELLNALRTELTSPCFLDVELPDPSDTAGILSFVSDFMWRFGYSHDMPENKTVYQELSFALLRFIEPTKHIDFTYGWKAGEEV